MQQKARRLAQRSAKAPADDSSTQCSRGKITFVFPPPDVTTIRVEKAVRHHALVFQNQIQNCHFSSEQKKEGDVSTKYLPRSMLSMFVIPTIVVVRNISLENRRYQKPDDDNLCEECTQRPDSRKGG